MLHNVSDKQQSHDNLISNYFSGTCIINQEQLNSGKKLAHMSTNCCYHGAGKYNSVGSSCKNFCRALCVLSVIGPNCQKQLKHQIHFLVFNILLEYPTLILLPPQMRSKSLVIILKILILCFLINCYWVMHFLNN